MKTPVWVLLVLALSWGSGTGWCEEPVRVVLDTGFEEGLAPFVRRSGTPAVTTEEARSGRHSLRIERSGGVALPPVDYAPGKRFRLEFWMKTVAVKRGANPWNRAGAQVTVQGPFSGRLRHRDIGQTDGSTEWTHHAATIAYDLKEIPHSFQVILQVWDAADGVVYFDDVRLVELPPVPADPRFPRRDEVAAHPPRVWPMPPVLDGPEAVDNGVVEMRFSPKGLPAGIRPLEMEQPALGDLSFAATVAAETLDTRSMVPVLNGYDARRGWMNRRRTVLAPPGGDEASLPRLEIFTEQFKASPLVAVFVRLWLPNETEVTGVELALALPPEWERFLWFDGNAPRRTAGGELRARLDGTTTKPFWGASSAAEDRGVVLYHPVPPELRRWHIDDYVPQTLAVDLAVEAGNRLVYRFPPLRTGAEGHCHSLDLTLFVHSYAGSVEQGLAPFAEYGARLLEDAPPFAAGMPDGYWTWPVPMSHRGLRINRYHPWETFATADAGAETFTYGHAGGFAWGWVSIPQKQMRFSPTSPNPWWRDSCLRMLAFHILRRDESGTPPHLNMYREWARNLENVDDFYRRHFCQDIEYRVGEWRQLLTRTDYLAEEERRDIYRELQHIRAIFDPDSPPKVGWTSTVPGGGYWYAYMNIPRHDMVDGPGYVLNTHMTSVGNAGELMLLSRDLGETEDFAAWRELFDRGVEGLLWALADERAWEDYDPNVLRYGLRVGGPRGYHVYAASEWMPRILRIAKEMGNPRLPELMACQERLLAADFMAEHPRPRENGRRALERAGQLSDPQ